MIHINCKMPKKRKYSSLQHLEEQNPLEDEKGKQQENSQGELLYQLGIACDTYEKFKEIPIFQCSICMDEFSLEPEWAKKMLNHFKENHLPSFINIEQEDYFFVEEIDPEAEEDKNLIPANFYVCLICNEEFNEASALSEHMEEHEETKPKDKKKGPVTRKGMKIQKVESLKNIQQPKLEQMEYECGICNSKFISHEDLEDHATDEHGNENYEFITEENQENQIIEVDVLPQSKGKKEFICDTCNTSWKTKVLLIRHMKTHLLEEDRDFQCFKCNKTFKHKRNKDEHELLHLPPQFKCNMCPRAFFRHNDFRKHMEVKHDVQVLDKRSLKKLTGQESEMAQKLSFSCKCCENSFSK